MQFPVSVKIEPSQSGKTFGVALVKYDKVIMVVKGCKLANGSNGQFVYGPSAKMDNGEWFRYLYMDKDFGNYVTKLAIEAMHKEPQRNAQAAPPDMSDVPF